MRREKPITFPSGARAIPGGERSPPIPFTGADRGSKVGWGIVGQEDTLREAQFYTNALQKQTALCVWMGYSCVVLLKPKR